MLKIGEFAKIANVSIHLLRYYDKIGLLKPSYTDTKTGYRHYQAIQFPRLNRIMALKELGFSLEQVSSMLDDPIAPDEIRGMLRLKRAQIEELLMEEQARLERIELRLRQIDDEGLFPDYNIEIKQIPPQPIITIPHISNEDALVKQLFDEFYGELGQLTENTGTAVVLFTGWDADEVEIGFLVHKHIPDLTLTVAEYAIEQYMLPAVDMMVSSLFAGARTDLHVAYEQMVTWFAAHNYAYTFPCRQLYLQPGQDEHDSENVVELQMPININHHRSEI